MIKLYLAPDLQHSYHARGPALSVLKKISMLWIMEKILYTTTVKIHKALNGGCGSMFNYISINITVMLHYAVFKHSNIHY